MWRLTVKPWIKCTPAIDANEEPLPKLDNTDIVLYTVNMVCNMLRSFLVFLKAKLMHDSIEMLFFIYLL